jgi:cell division protein FtsZ
VLRQGVQSISELVNETGLINVDFAHLKRLMQQGGGSYMSMGYGQGPDKANQAVEQALHHPLLESIPIESATGIIANFTGDSSLSFYEVAEAMNKMQERTGHQAEIIPGLMTDDRLQDRAQVILIITGLGGRSVSEMHPLPIQNAVKPIPMPARVMTNQPTFTQQTTEPATDRNNALTNLDMPAFIRKRYRMNG